MRNNKLKLVLVYLYVLFDVTSDTLPLFLLHTRTVPSLHGRVMNQRLHAWDTLKEYKLYRRDRDCTRESVEAAGRSSSAWKCTQRVQRCYTRSSIESRDDHEMNRHRIASAAVAQECGAIITSPQQERRVGRQIDQALHVRVQEMPVPHEPRASELEAVQAAALRRRRDLRRGCKAWRHQWRHRDLGWTPRGVRSCSNTPVRA